LIRLLRIVPFLLTMSVCNLQAQPMADDAAASESVSLIPDDLWLFRAATNTATGSSAGTLAKVVSGLIQREAGRD